MFKKTLFAISVLILALFPTVSATNMYQANYYIQATKNPDIIYTTSFKSTIVNCSIELQNFVSVNTTSYTYISNTYYSPDNINIGYGNRNLTANYTCLPQGLVSTSTNYNNGFEGESYFSRSGGTSSYTVIQATTTCYTTSDWINITSGYGDVDSRGFSYNGLFQMDCSGTGSYIPKYIINTTSFNACSGNIINNQSYTNFTRGQIGVIPPSFDILTCSATPQGTFEYPFKTGETGNIHYQFIDFPSFNGGVAAFGYYEPYNPSGTFVSLLGTYEGDLTLSPNTDYVFLVGGTFNNYIVPQSPPNVNISINIYSPEWSCGEWSECTSGLQSRTCTDPLSKVPSKIEYQGCIESSYFSLYLGFEDGYDFPNRKCTQDYFGSFCTGYVPKNITNIYPTGWDTINLNDDDLLTITSEASTDGVKSLKMWYLPPQISKPDPSYNFTTCNYTDTGYYSDIFKPINETLFVSYNITFPSPYMTVEYDVKGCPANVIQSDTWCNIACYGNCTEKPLWNYDFRIFDPSTYNTILDYTDTAKEDWSSRYIDLSNAGLEINHTYNFIFFVTPTDPYNQHGDCIYLDGVNISIRGGELSCSSNFCIGYDLYIPNNINGSCVYTVKTNSPYCLPNDVQEKALNKEDYCINTTLYTWDNITLDWLSIPNSDYCIAYQEQQSIYNTDTGILGNYADILDNSGLGFASSLLTPIFIILIILLVISGLIVHYIGLGGRDAGIVFTVIFLSLMLVSSLVGLMPVWIPIVLIVLTGLVIAKMLSSTIT